MPVREIDDMYSREAIRLTSHPGKVHFRARLEKIIGWIPVGQYRGEFWKRKISKVREEKNLEKWSKMG